MSLDKGVSKIGKGKEEEEEDDEKGFFSADTTTPPQQDPHWSGHARHELK